MAGTKPGHDETGFPDRHSGKIDYAALLPISNESCYLDGHAYFS
jgi:hypothetical protein